MLGLVSDSFGRLFAEVGAHVAGFVLIGASTGAVVLAARWGLGVALGALKGTGSK